MSNCKFVSCICFCETVWSKYGMWCYTSLVFNFPYIKWVLSKHRCIFYSCIGDSLPCIQQLFVIWSIHNCDLYFVVSEKHVKLQPSCCHGTYTGQSETLVLPSVYLNCVLSFLYELEMQYVHFVWSKLKSIFSLYHWIKLSALQTVDSRTLPSGSKCTSNFMIFHIVYLLCI